MIGHDVIEARDGSEALNLLQSGAHVDLVFTDMIMPGGLSGRDVAHTRQGTFSPVSRCC
jgi:CheY-like chemotaxis protein